MLTLLWSAKESLRKSYDLEPILGFLEINLVKIKGNHKNGVIFEFFIDRKDKEKTNFEKVKTSQIIYQNYALSFTICQKEGDK